MEKHYNERLAMRIRLRLAKVENVIEETGINGMLIFYINDYLAIMIERDNIGIMFDADRHEQVIKRKGAQIIFGKGSVQVESSGTEYDEDLDYWVNLAVDASKKGLLHLKRKRN